MQDAECSLVGGDETEASQDILTDNIADPPLSIYVIDPFIRDKVGIFPLRGNHNMPFA